ncbi:MAG: aldehyde dehydrogenase family protein, partial [Actinomycetes bacterium]
MIDLEISSRATRVGRALVKARPRGTLEADMLRECPTLSQIAKESVAKLPKIYGFLTFLPGVVSKRSISAYSHAYALKRRTMKKLQNFVNGVALDSKSGKVSELISPVTGKAYATAPVSDAADVDHAIQAAATAFESWRD